MSIITLDFESTFDKEYSLKKMSPVEYILDPRWEMIGCAVLDDHPTRFLEHDDFVVYVNSLKERQAGGEKIKVITHNGLFDCCILSWRYGFVPDLMIDTLGMSRALLFAFTGSAALERIAEHLGLPAKGKTILKVAGMRKADIKANGLWDEFASYACHDAELCRMIFNVLSKDFPPEEFLINDMVLRCAVVPRFRLDTQLLAEDKAELARQKEQLLGRTGFTAVDLMSNPRFANCLHMLGIDPPRKVSPTTGEMTYAFAKSDPAMRDLAEHPRPDVQALVAARVGHKSTIAETRAERLLRISMLEWPGQWNVGGTNSWGPIPLRYAGAHTGRLSGDWQLNCQNWPRFSFDEVGNKEPGKIRRAHRAPPGYLVVKRDASQIEARIVAWLAGQDDLTQAFREGRDVYCEFGPSIYKRTITKADVDERFVAKGAVLGLGFGLGSDKFQRDIAAKSYVNLGRTIRLDGVFAAEIVRAYRQKYTRVPMAWSTLDGLIAKMARPECHEIFGPVEFRYQKIILPNGLPLFYHDLQYDQAEGEWWCTYGKSKKKIYHAKVFENIVQALARVLTMGAALKLQREFPDLPRLAHQVHDDLVYVVPDYLVEHFDKALEWCIQDVPDWAKGLPLASEAGIGSSYGDAH